MPAPARRPRRLRPRLLLALLAGALLPVVPLTPAAAETTATVWDQLGGSATHRGFEEGMSLLTRERAPALKRSWGADVGGDVRSSPVVRGRRVYVGSQNNAVVALDGGGGGVVWRAVIGGPVTSAPATDGTTVFVVTRGCTVYALSAATGAIKWKVRPEECSDFGGGLLLHGGKLFVTSTSGVLRALSPTTGGTIWAVRQASAKSSTAPTGTGSLVISTWDGGVVTAVDSATGRRVWTSSVPSHARSTPSVDGKLVYVGDDDGGLSALSVTTGVRVWRRALAALSSDPVVRSVPAVDTLRVYVHLATYAPSGGQLVALDKASGARLWAKSVGFATSSPAVANGVVYSASTTGVLRALSTYDGASLWSSTPGTTVSSPAPADDAVYVGNKGGELVRYGLASAPSGLDMPVGDLASWRKVFSDDFRLTSLDSSKWSKYSGTPGSDPGAQWAPSHVTVGNGTVKLVTYKDSAYDGKWTSGAINNGRAGVASSSGRYDIRMRAQKAKGINLAGLLWPSSAGWPPEVDFVEDRDGDRVDYTTTIHYKNSTTSHGMIHGKKAIDMTDWHTYGVEWTPGKVVYRLDGVIWKTVYSDNAPRVAMEFAIQTNAVTNGAVKPDSTTPATSRVEIDWVVGYVPK